MSTLLGKVKYFFSFIYLLFAFVTSFPRILQAKAQVPTFQPAFVTD